MTDKILSILNPIHLPTVQERRNIAFIIAGVKHELKDAEHPLADVEYRKLDQRFEELTRGKYHLITKQVGGGHPIPDKEIWQPAILKKEMFVCEVKEPHWKDYPKLAGFDSEKLENATIEYNQAQAKVWFENWMNGVVENSPIIYWKGNGSSSLCFKDKNLRLGDVITPINSVVTVFDFIIELDRYNRTAKEPIKINWTENFGKELIK